MEVKIKHIDSDLNSDDKKMYNDFIKYLNKQYPVKTNLTILFLGEKSDNMSTGSQSMDGTLRVLSKNRLNRDIMRTLAHEWVHAYQRHELGRERGPDIGGQNEDEANAFAGRLIKMFERDFPDYNKLVFEGVKGLSNKVNLIKEQIEIKEKENAYNSLILEMKKIGIEKLPYSYSAMKNFIDSKTMNIHYNKHYKGYVKKLNDALSKKDYKNLDLEKIIKTISRFDTKIRNNAGGAFNHALFWKMLSPKKQTPKKEILKKINDDFGNIKKLKDEFNDVAKKRFGSGWAWLVLTKSNKLKIMSTPNQDNPLMNIVKSGGYPLLGLDLWEHAYYLKYQNKRDEYISKFWNHVNWEFVNELYLSKTKKTLKESYFKVLLENEETQPDLKKAMSRELQKIRLIPLDIEAAVDAINNIITAEINRGLNFNRTIEGLMSLDLSNISERSKFRFNNYYQRFIKSRTRGFDFEALIAGLLNGTVSDSLSTPYDITTPQGEKISCKIVRSSEEAPVLKGIRDIVNQYISNYSGDEENKNKLIELSNDSKNLIYNLINSDNQDLNNIGEDLIELSLSEIDGMLVGQPLEDFKLKLYYYDKNALSNILRLPGYTNASKTKGTLQIRFSTKILKLNDSSVSPMKGHIQFPVISYDEYVEFLIGDDRTKEIIDLFNSLGLKYGVKGLGGNIPQDIIRNLSKNYKFKKDIQRILK